MPVSDGNVRSKRYTLCVEGKEWEGRVRRRVLLAQWSAPLESNGFEGSLLEEAKEIFADETHQGLCFADRMIMLKTRWLVCVLQMPRERTKFYHPTFREDTVGVFPFPRRFDA